MNKNNHADDQNSDRADSRANERCSRADDRASRSEPRSDQIGKESGGSWRSFGEKLAEMLQQSKADRLTDRVHNMHNLRERMPLDEVREAREMVKGWKPDQISEKTQARYDGLNERMQRTGQRPEQIAGTRGSFKIYRAATVHQARSKLRAALKDRDSLLRTQKTEKGVQKSVLDSVQNRVQKTAPDHAQIRDAESRIRDAVAVLQKYPPGSGDPVQDRERKSAYTGAQYSNRGNGKRDVLDQRPADWRDRVWQEVGERDRDAVAVTALTGARPAELTKGVRVDHAKNGDLKFTIRGAKIGEDRGQEKRKITISKTEAAKSVEGRHLLEQIKPGLGRDVKVGNEKNFSDRVRHASERAMPDAQRTVSPYDYRHAFSSRLKADDRLDASDRASALGQQAERSSEAYGRASSAGRSGSGSISSASASSSTRTGR